LRVTGRMVNDRERAAKEEISKGRARMGSG
jgi:hypothetical protein